MEDVVFLKKLVNDLKITRDIAAEKKMNRLNCLLPQSTDKQDNIILGLNVVIAFYEKLINECEKQLEDKKHE